MVDTFFLKDFNIYMLRFVVLTAFLVYTKWRMGVAEHPYVLLGYPALQNAANVNGAFMPAQPLPLTLAAFCDSSQSTISLMRRQMLPL